jgi:hypothetical protein
MTIALKFEFMTNNREEMNYGHVLATYGKIGNRWQVIGFVSKLTFGYLSSDHSPT